MLFALPMVIVAAGTPGGVAWAVSSRSRDEARGGVLESGRVEFISVAAIARLSRRTAV